MRRLLAPVAVLVALAVLLAVVASGGGTRRAVTTSPTTSVFPGARWLASGFHLADPRALDLVIVRETGVPDSPKCRALLKRLDRVPQTPDHVEMERQARALIASSGCTSVALAP